MNLGTIRDSILARLVAKEAAELSREEQEQRRGLVTERDAIREQLDAAIGEHDRRLTTASAKRDRAWQAWIDADGAYRSVVHERQQAVGALGGRVAALDREIRVAADPRVADLRRTFRLRYLDAARAGELIRQDERPSDPPRLDGMGRRYPDVRSNHGAVSRLLAAIDAAELECDQLMLEHVDDLDAALAAIEARVAEAWEGLATFDPWPVHHDRPESGKPVGWFQDKESASSLGFPVNMPIPRGAR